MEDRVVEPQVDPHLERLEVQAILPQQIQCKVQMVEVVEVQLLINNQAEVEDQQLLEPIVLQVHQDQAVLVLRLQFLRPLQLMQVEAEVEVLRTLPMLQGVEVLVEEVLEDVCLLDPMLVQQEAQILVVAVAVELI
jgi:hypothetical protein